MTALVVYLQNTLARLRERQEGQTMAEYALILGGIAILVIAGILILGPAVRDLFKDTGSCGPELPDRLVADERCRRAAVSRGSTKTRKTAAHCVSAAIQNRT